MQALILAAGWATRMGDLARTTPKHLLPIGARCSLDFVVERLAAIDDMQQIHVITHDVFFPQFVDWAAAHEQEPRLTLHNDQTTSEATKLGSIGDIKYFLDTAHPDDDLIIVLGDNVFDFDLRPLAARGVSDIVVGLYDVESLELATRYGIVELDGDDRIVSFVEKPAVPRSTLAATGIYGFPHARLADFDAYLADGGSTDKFGSVMECLYTRRRVFGQVFHGRWFDIGSPDEYERVNREFGGDPA
ncbi:MAG: sugar phosphate nucleotidyltransferase [Acidimicrobiaceae bacterium]|nr:sugar phosphate nucleotidyltransferase [Acidimicrobiaceae bacterium]